MRQGCGDGSESIDSKDHGVGAYMEGYRDIGQAMCTQITSCSKQDPQVLLSRSRADLRSVINLLRVGRL